MQVQPIIRIYNGISTLTTTSQTTALRHRDILAIALPMIASNISTPLLGLVDTAVIGNQGQTELIGAVAVGASILTFIYWTFGFLQMGTSGLTAQAVGAEDRPGIEGTLLRGLAIAASVGVTLCILQWPLTRLGLWLMGPPEAESALASGYLHIRIWSAPFALSNLVLLGWFVGQRAARTALLLQVFMNLINLALNLYFVLVLNMGVAGIATGTLLAEISAFVFGLVLVNRQLRQRGGRLFDLPMKYLQDAAALRRMLSLNRDILIRTLCLLIAFSFFTSQGARLGSVPLAANAILMQLVTFTAFFLDGFSLASETLSGQAFGARRPDRIKSAMVRSAIWALGTASLLSALYLVFGSTVIRILTNVEPVRDLAGEHLYWLVLMPLLGVWSFLLDGLFFGATRGPHMRNAAILSLTAFLGSWAVLMPTFGLNGLWASLMIYYVARALFLGIYVPKLLADAATEQTIPTKPNA